MHISVNNLNNIQNNLKKNNYQLSKNTPKIIAVSKTFPIENIMPLIEYGHIHFGENKIQESLSKWPLIKKNYPKIKLHMIGKIQSNKAKYLLPLFDYIHSLDSLKIANIISKIQLQLKLKPKIFIQINLANEKQKSGIQPENLNEFYNICVNDLDLNIVGFMCLPPLNEMSSKYFKIMSELKNLYHINELSMGMSDDYLEAIKNGSTFLRLGSCIFGPRN
jgi:pyridoxal phosphate enzyme (YggS family)